MAKLRLIDAVLARRLCDDRDRARRLILAGEILVNGHRISQPAMFVKSDATLTLTDLSRPVSRAGHKLEYALTRWDIRVESIVAADIGAASGGFTERLLRHGAQRVYAIETGKGQLSWKLRQDPRVVVMEETNILYLETLPERIALAVIDTSWTPLRQALPRVERLLGQSGEVIALLKPNYELQDPARLARGILEDERVRQEVVRTFLQWAEEQGWTIHHAMPSPIAGDKGNVEWLTHMSRHSR